MIEQHSGTVRSGTSYPHPYRPFPPPEVEILFQAGGCKLKGPHGPGR